MSDLETLLRRALPSNYKVSVHQNAHKCETVISLQAPDPNSDDWLTSVIYVPDQLLIYDYSDFAAFSKQLKFAILKLNEAVEASIAEGSASE